jgi:hypothetical protein
MGGFCNGLNGPLLPVSNDCGLRRVETWMYFLCKCPKVNSPTLILITEHYAKGNRRCIAVSMPKFIWAASDW